MSDITIYHNPKCGTSRNVLQALRDGGVEPIVIEYLKTPPDRATLKKLVAAMGVPLREVIRAKETLYKELGLDNPGLSDDQLLDAMLANPILINRPIVVAPKGTMLVRPSERLAEIFP
ncbi:arsenate reductase (glutaredoxin) [Herbaspirillum sp. LeCh32-8]|nr:arsenate reductase (glutaredoxin) [Herbaspirillum sp. LeCh32-8]